MPKENDSSPQATARQVAIVMFLRDGGVASYFTLARLSGLAVEDVDELLNTKIALPKTSERKSLRVRCRQCGSRVCVIPCRVCSQSREYPHYVMTRHEGDTRKSRESLVHSFRKRGIFNTRFLSEVSGLTEDDILDIQRKPDKPSKCDPGDGTLNLSEGVAGKAMRIRDANLKAGRTPVLHADTQAVQQESQKLDESIFTYWNACRDLSSVRMTFSVGEADARKAIARHRRRLRSQSICS